MHLPVTLGKSCPICGAKTRRVHMPWYIRPARWILLGKASYRRCVDHHWRGLAAHW
jgi:hypothetical protein